jgi:hypothetical protein
MSRSTTAAPVVTADSNGAASNHAPGAKKSKPSSGVSKKFLDAQLKALESERANYLRQAESLQAEADSLTEDREPGDVQFDEESGTAAVDSSGQGNDGDLTLAESAAAPWQTVTVDLIPTEGTFPLYLVFPDRKVRLNWMEFEPGEVVEPRACPKPDQRKTVIVGGIDSGVPNYDTGDGCTVNDLLVAGQAWDSRREFLLHVREVVAALKADGVLTAREARDINKAAGRSDVGRGNVMR